ncbi:MAG TPA: hypothetical protein VNC22_23295 [Sporichthya sp.]|jgi:hypothetical protein|nr:hypothetical protein [Sporichthya sp.]
MALPIRHQRRIARQFAPDIMKWTLMASEAMARLSGQNAMQSALIRRLVDICQERDVPLDELNQAITDAQIEASMSLEVAWMTAAAESGLDLEQVLAAMKDAEG